MPFDKFQHLVGEPLDNQETAANKASILIIDDDPGVREMLKLSLQRYYMVRSCADGDEGVRTIDTHTDAVLLDIKMPGKDGLQVYQEIKTKIPDVPIIFYSAFQDLLEGAKLRQEYRPFDYLHKDSNIDELYRCLEKAVRYCRITRNLGYIESE